jgi:hypothetical protein
MLTEPQKLDFLEDFVRGRLLGTVQVELSGIDNSEITFPVVQVRWDIYDLLDVAYNNTNFTEVTVTITNEGVNEYKEMMRWAGPFTTVTHGVWGIVNVALCIRAFVVMQTGRNAGTIAVGLHLLANIRTSAMKMVLKVSEHDI